MAPIAGANAQIITDRQSVSLPDQEANDQGKKPPGNGFSMEQPGTASRWEAQKGHLTLFFLIFIFLRKKAKKA